jgi:glucokinase
MAPGTGLGECLLVPAGKDWEAYPSEGGHCDFAPRNREEIELLQWLLDRRQRVSVEQLVSGPGIASLYHFLTDTGRAPRDEPVERQLAEGRDPAPTIQQLSLQPQATASSRTLRLWVELCGAEAGNLALKLLATGGVYLGGGIAPRLRSMIESGPFLEAFRAKAPMDGLLAAVPVTLVMDPQTPLYGAARRAARLIREKD